MQTKDVETHQVFFLLSEQALLQISRLLNLLFWPKVCDTNDTNNCFAPLQIPTKFKTVLTALGPGPHDEDTAINLTLMVILHTENWPVGIYMLILILFSCTRIASTPSSRMSGTTTLSPASSTWTWPGQTLCFSGEMKNCCATWLQISRHANNTISCTLAIGEPRIQVAGTLLTQVKWLFLCVLVLLITLCHWQYICTKKSNIQGLGWRFMCVADLEKSLRTVTMTRASLKILPSWSTILPSSLAGGRFTHFPRPSLRLAWWRTSSWTASTPTLSRSSLPMTSGLGYDDGIFDISSCRKDWYKWSHFLLSCGRRDTLGMKPRFYFKIGMFVGRIDLTSHCNTMQCIDSEWDNMEISSVF